MNELSKGPDCWSKQRILFCGHAGYFVGDVIVTPMAVTIIATQKININLANSLVRKDLSAAQWHITDNHFGSYWNDQTGRFVLPREALTRITAENLHLFT